MAFPLTEEQKKIVDDQDGELLVSAAAGSGKTRVLVERLLDRVDREGQDIDRFLVITYTKAAAAELRARVAQELSLRLAQRPGDRRLRRQTTLVYQAHISTIHAFCAALLRESGYLLDLEPDFRLCDEGEAQVLMQRALEEVLDRRYEGLDGESPFAQLVDTLSAGRDDSKLVQIALDIYGRVQSYPDPVQWLREQGKVWELAEVSDMSQTPWGALLLEDAKRQAVWCRQELARALAMAEEDELLQINYGPSLSVSIEEVDRLLAARSWDEGSACLPVAFPTAGRKKKRTVELSPMELERAASLGERMKVIRTRSKKRLEKLAQLLEGDSASLLEELALSRPAVQALMELVTDFQAAYAAEKARRGVLDFSDLEHFALRLLREETGEPTQLAKSWSARFDEVMVDEYQDTNQVQNEIFTALSDGGRKLFQVGDVKQSIYRFRLADPTIFLNKYLRFPDGDQVEKGHPRRRILSRNFRSRPQVLLGCNDLFKNIMSTEFGELDYTEDQALVPGASFPEGEDYALELDALDLSFLGDQEEAKDSKDFLEARFAAKRIRELLDAPLLIGPEGAQRPVRPSDIMILLRSPGTVLHHYLRALEEVGVPWSAEGGEDLFASTEVNVALSILRIVDNPRQDVALLAALRSPVYGFTADQLAMLRSQADGDFYHALEEGANRGDQACQSFLEQLEQLRFGAGDRTCRQLIWHIYEKTNLLGIFGAMDRGGERQDNLLALYALAGQMEESGCRSLFQFLLRLDRLRETGGRIPPVLSGREGDGVSILSIHRSKGLERPVVLVCGLSRRLNREDLKRPVLFHPVLGVGPKGLDRERMIEYPTLARRAVARQLEREMMAEELRLLYVAMTRAKEKLILTLALTGGVRELEWMGEDLSAPVSPMVLESQQSVGQWVLLHALTRPEAQVLRDLAGLTQPEPGELGPAWDLRWVEGAPLSQMEEAPTQARQTSAEEEGDEELLWRLEWNYPYLPSANIPSKLTATQLKGRALDREAAEEGSQAPLEQPQGHAPLERPDFMVRERGLTPAQQGTALHLAMQYLPLEGDHSPEGIAKAVEGLVEGGYLTPAQGKSVRPEPLAAFFRSPLGQELAGAKECHREFKFSLLVLAKDYFDAAAPEEEILLQGVVDAWFDDGDGVTVVDFKSDRIRPGGEEERGALYRPQLQAYSKALSAMLQRPVKRKVLWFFATGTALEL